MPMGIVSDKEFNSELNRASSDKKPLPEIKPSTISPVLEGQIIDVNRGRPTGAVEVPNTLRKVIGEEAAINGRQAGLDLAETFGLKPSSVSAYVRGATSTATYDETPNAPHIDSSKDRVSKRARNKLMSALHHLTKDKMSAAKAKDLAGIAKDMAVVIRTMEPEAAKGPTNVNNGPTFVFYSPQQRKEEAFDVVYAKE